MTYGVISDETAMWLRESGYDHAWLFPETTVENFEDRRRSISIIIGGALDEEFDVNDNYDSEDLVNCIADHLANNSDLDNWEVAINYNEEEDLYRRSSQ